MKEPELLRTTPVGFKIHFGTDIAIQENEAAKDMILTHRRCTVQRLAWFGEFEADYKKYYIGATGAMGSDTTSVFVLEQTL